MGTLKMPRCRVMWGGENLSSYSGGGIPEGSSLVYDVSVDLAAEGEGPTGSMKWDPSGPGMKIYEKFVGNGGKTEEQITVEYNYPTGQKIVFIFVWGGTQVNYGNDMSVTVKLTSELAGKVNGSVRSTAFAAEDEKKGEEPTAILDKTKEQYGLDGDIVKLSKETEEHWKDVKLDTMYGSNRTFGNAVSQLATQTGDKVFANNIGKTNMAIVAPYSYKGKSGYPKVEEPPKGNPDPEKRYGYFLGPAMIDNISRTYTWKPPQQSNTNQPGTQEKARDPKTGQFVKQKPENKPQQNVKDSDKETSAPIGTSGGRANPGVRSVENPEGPNRQNALNDEKSASMQVDTFMVPALCGIKPNDIVFIPALSGGFMEDWEVSNVSYSQSNGEINVSIQGKRTFGSAEPMNPEAYKEWKSKAEGKGLVGGKASLESWDKYAWGS